MRYPIRSDLLNKKLGTPSFFRLVLQVVLIFPFDCDRHAASKKTNRELKRQRSIKFMLLAEYDWKRASFEEERVERQHWTNEGQLEY